MTTREKSELLQGTLDLLILKTLEQAPLHGYAIAQAIEQGTRALLHVPQGSLYPALHRLENRGWLSATWERTETGREAKVYRLTRAGRVQLEREVADWRRLSDAIGWILQPEGRRA
jgi:PadR family transcriptional regulator, regulatory protein PadR